MNEEKNEGEEAFDPSELFDASKYNTLIIGREGFNARQNELADLLLQLLQPNTTRARSEEIFTELRKNKAQDLLVQAIRNAPSDHDRKLLAAACWESGLDFSKHFAFFAALVCGDDLAVAVEALTVIQEMQEDISREDLKRTLSGISSGEPANAMVPELRNFIHLRLDQL